MVQIEHGRVHLQTIETDVVRWREERIELAADADRRELIQAIRRRLDELQPDRAGLLTLIRWTVSCQGKLGRELENYNVCDSILASASEPQVKADLISVSIEPEHRRIPADRYEEETILGDFLRKVQELQLDPARLIDLIGFLPESPVKHELASMVRLSTPSERQRIFERAISLGVDLLSSNTDGVNL